MALQNCGLSQRSHVGHGGHSGSLRRVYRLRERYRYEEKARSLSPTADAALRKVFEDDAFIRAWVRGISEHVETGDFQLLDTDNVRVRSWLSHPLTSFSQLAPLC